MAVSYEGERLSFWRQVSFLSNVTFVNLVLS